MGLEKVAEYILQGGPYAMALVMAVIAYNLWKKVEKQQRLIEKMHDEKEEMFREWQKETDVRTERFQSAISASTIAMTTNAASMDAVKVSQNAIMTFISGIITGSIKGKP